MVRVKITPHFLAAWLLICLTPASGQSGYQVINGTRVFTVVDQAAGVATFSNDCGSQRLTQRQLQAGAITSDIIPCPRPQRTPPSVNVSPPAPRPPVAAPPVSIPRSSQSDPPARSGPVSDTCLSVAETKVVSGSVGECETKDGTKGHWNFTYVRSTLTMGCPKEIDFTYYDPGDEAVEQFSTPFNVQTCNAPPVGITTKK